MIQQKCLVPQIAELMVASLVVFPCMTKQWAQIRGLLTFGAWSEFLQTEQSAQRPNFPTIIYLQGYPDSLA